MSDSELSQELDEVTLTIQVSGVSLFLIENQLANES